LISVSLVQSEYISSSIPGGNFAGTLGKRSSIYALNLRNPAYGRAAPDGCTLLFWSDHGPQGDLHEAFWLKRDIDSFRRTTDNYKKEEKLKFVIINYCDAGEFARYIHTKLSGPILKRLQWELIDIASTHIGSNFEGVDENYDDVVSKLESRVFANLNDTAPNRSDILEQGVAVLYRYIKTIVIRTIKFLQGAKEQVNGKNFYQCLPIQRGQHSYGSFTIEIDSNNKAESNERKVRVLNCDFHSPKVIAIRVFDNLNEISVDARHEFALLTKPIKHPKLRTPPNRSTVNAIDSDSLS
jgi:hypothetical protein